MTEKYLIDTNVLMETPSVIDSLDGEVIVLGSVLEELDKLKVKPGNTGAKARGAVRYLREYKEKITIELDETLCEDFPSYLDKSKVDNILVGVAKRLNAVLVSGDFIVLYKAEKLFDLEVIDSFNRMGLYTGVRKIYIDKEDETTSKLYIRHITRPDSNVFNLNPNEYLIIYDMNKVKSVDRETGEIEYKKVDKIKRWDAVNKKLVNLIDVPKSVIRPRNDLQACAIDLAFNKEIPIKIIAGTFGSGKTFTGVRAGEYFVKETGDCAKLMCVRNPIGDTSSADIGFLPGTKEEKTEDFFKAIGTSLKCGMQGLENMVKLGQIGFEIPYYMKGMTISDSYIVVDEAEDLSLKTLKLIGTRIGDRSSICFCGDYKQAESRYIGDNGLVKMINELKSNKLVGNVVLEDDVRSEASKVFADL